eukprot:scaffold93716_cov22-Tisochrysis_lutea.AAC.1
MMMYELGCVNCHDRGGNQRVIKSMQYVHSSLQDVLGTSTYCFNPANGRINKHIDTWDSINNQEFFSVEAFADVLRQMTDLASTPDGLEQPQYRVI